MSAGLAFAGITCTVAIYVALQRRPNARILENLVLAPTLALWLLGIVGSVAAAFGWFSSLLLAAALVGGAIAAACVATRSGRSTRSSGGANPLALLVLILLLLGAAVLRAPPMYTPLAGRDQGTYTLRAEHLAEHDAIGWRDPVLARAGVDPGARPGARDILGLYGKHREPERVGTYESPYRPGWYLADRDRGRVVPQFFHLHPALLAVATRILGLGRLGWLGWCQSLLALLGLHALARRFWPRGPWPFVATSLVALSPLAIWVDRNALSETTALLLWVTAALCIRRAEDERGNLHLAAALLGALAWLRGDGWLIAPAVLGSMWLIADRERGRRGVAAVYSMMLLGSVALHVATSYPYVHDELARLSTRAARLPAFSLVLAAFASVIAGWSFDVLYRHHPKAAVWRDRVLRWTPRAVAVLLVAIGLGYASSLDAPRPPWSRLDAALPLLGAPQLLAAGIGVVIALRRWHPRGQHADAWWTALVLATLVMLAVHARRAIPALSFFYYGRYLVPFVLPAVALLSTATLVFVHARMRTRFGATRSGIVAGIIGVGLVASVAHPLASAPQVRLPEFAGAERLLDALQRRLPANAVVIAGGEGWHHGHTFNQVGGALALRSGVTVLPYRTREEAHATARAVLDDDRPVFMLLNEAAHQYGSAEAPIAALDDRLPPPLLASRVDLFELFTHRLTPIDGTLPRRVTRDELRMALVELSLDPNRTGETTAFDRAPAAGVRLGGHVVMRDDVACLHPHEPLTLTFDSDRFASARQLVLVTDPRGTTSMETWRVEVDGVRLPTHAFARRERDTLGPLVFSKSPTTIALWGTSERSRKDACPHGGVVQVRLLDPDRGFLPTAEVTAKTFAPPREYGHRVAPTRWVPGFALGPMRPLLGDPPARVGSNLVLEPGTPLSFAPTTVNAHAEYDVVLTLTHADAPEGAAIVVRSSSAVLARIAPPTHRERVWQSPPLPWKPEKATETIEVTLEASDDATVLLRDLAFFERRPPVASARAME